MLNKTGVPTKEMVLSKFPDDSILEKPKAIIECYEEIPCNPCATSCPFDAIRIEDEMNAIPKLDLDLCTGCGQCVIHCPGIAIMVSQLLNQKAIFKIAYEFLPRPQVGEIWKGVNRNGDVICDCEIQKVYVPKNNHTAMITIVVDAKYLHDFVSIRHG